MTVKRLIAVLRTYPPDAVVLVPNLYGGHARALLPGGRDLLETHARRVVTSRLIPVSRWAARHGPKRLRFTRYELVRYGTQDQDFPVSAVYFNVLDE